MLFRASFTLFHMIILERTLYTILKNLERTINTIVKDLSCALKDLNF